MAITQSPANPLASKSSARHSRTSRSENANCTESPTNPLSIRIRGVPTYSTTYRNGFLYRRHNSVKYSTTATPPVNSSNKLVGCC